MEFLCADTYTPSVPIFSFRKKIRRMPCKPVNLYTVSTRRTIDNIALFLWSIPSCFLIHFVF